MSSELLEIVAVWVLRVSSCCVLPSRILLFRATRWAGLFALSGLRVLFVVAAVATLEVCFTTYT